MTTANFVTPEKSYILTTADFKKSPFGLDDIERIKTKHLILGLVGGFGPKFGGFQEIARIYGEILTFRNFQYYEMREEGGRGGGGGEVGERGDKFHPFDFVIHSAVVQRSPLPFDHRLKRFELIIGTSPPSPLK